MSGRDEQTRTSGDASLATEQGGSAAPSPARRRPEEGAAAPPEAAAADGGVHAPDAPAGEGSRSAAAPEGSAETFEGSSPEPGNGSAEASVESDIDELVKLAQQRDEYLALAQRTQADFENYRKRAAKEAKAAEVRGVVKLVKEFLPALDNLARAMDAADKDDPLLEGVRLVHQDLLGALKRLGIESYSPAGEEFDPNQHEAMAQQPVEGARAGTVVEVYQAGYRLNGTIIRPARVVVAA